MRLCLILEPIFPILGCIALAAAGCGSDAPPDTLTCAWLASAANCWSNTAQAATSCLPTTSDGMFSADNSICTYPSGVVVSFTPAVTLPLPDNAPWNFTVNDAGGQACLHYEETGGGNAAKLVVGSQTVTISFIGLAMSIHCPDGSSVQNGNALNLLDCPGNIGALPGHFIGYSDTSVSFGLIGMSDPTKTVSLFQCSK